MSRKCAETQLLIKPYLEKKLSELQTVSMQMHLDECVECRRVLQQEQELLSLFTELPSHECSADLLDSLHSIPEQNVAVSGDDKSRQNRYGNWTVAATLAAAALLLFLFMPAEIPDETELVSLTPEQQQIAGQVCWSMALAAGKVQAARLILKEEIARERIFETINSALSVGAESPFLTIRQTANGG